MMLHYMLIEYAKYSQAKLYASFQPRHTWNQKKKKGRG